MRLESFKDRGGLPALRAAFRCIRDENLDKPPQMTDRDHRRQWKCQENIRIAAAEAEGVGGAQRPCRAQGVDSRLPVAGEDLRHRDDGDRRQAKIGPVKATFNGDVTLSNIDPPNGYTIAGEGKGGVAGFAKGGADVKLVADGDGTLLDLQGRTPRSAASSPSSAGG